MPPAPCPLHPAPCTLPPAPCPCTLYPAPVPVPAPCPCPCPCTLPLSLNPAPAPCTLPCTLHPAPAPCTQPLDLLQSNGVLMPGILCKGQGLTLGCRGSVHKDLPPGKASGLDGQRTRTLVQQSSNFVPILQCTSHVTPSLSAPDSQDQSQYTEELCVPGAQGDADPLGAPGSTQDSFWTSRHCIFSNKRTLFHPALKAKISGAAPVQLSLFVGPWRCHQRRDSSSSERGVHAFHCVFR